MRREAVVTDEQVVEHQHLFAIHRALREIGIGQPAPDVTAQMLQGLGRVETSIEHIAHAIEAREALKAPPEPIPLPAKKKG